MIEVDKCKRCVRIAATWHGKDLMSISKKYSDHGVVTEGWDEAEGNLKVLEEGEEIEWPTAKGVQHLKRLGARMEVIFWFIAIVDFHKLYKVEPKAAGLAISKWLDEQLNEIQGVIVKPTADCDLPHPFRRIVLWSERLTMLQEDVMLPSKRLRVHEPEETFTSVHKQSYQNLPVDRWH